MKNDISRRAEKAKIQDLKFRQSPDIVVKVVCRYRAELFFKISRKTKLAKLFGAWTDRMETSEGKKIGELTCASKLTNGVARASGASPKSSSGTSSGSSTNFIFTHGGRQVDAEQTPEEAAMEDGDEILAVELMDLTESPSAEDPVRFHPVSAFFVFADLTMAHIGRERAAQTKIAEVLVRRPYRVGSPSPLLPCASLNGRFTHSSGQRGPWKRSLMACTCFSYAGCGTRTL